MTPISPRTHSPGSNSAPPPRPGDAPLAGYLMARAAIHQTIDGTDLKNLRAGQESMQQVRDLLPLGRANVNQDIRKAKDEHLRLRHIASRQLQFALTNSQRNPQGAIPPNDINRIVAASSQYAKTGTCGSFAANTAPLHAAKLADTKDERAIVAIANQRTIDHAWAEMMPKGMGDDGKPILHGNDVIMDGWCKENLAILREDSEFARLKDGKGHHLTHRDHLNHETGPEALREVEKFKAQITSNPALEGVFHRHFESLVASGFKPEKIGLWDAESVFHEDFRKQAGAALHKAAKDASPTPIVDPFSVEAKHASMAEIQAVGVARSLGSNIRSAITEAPGIIASAKKLFPSPESMGNLFLSQILRCFQP